MKPPKFPPDRKEYGYVSETEKSRFLHRSFMKFAMLTIICILICICSRLKAQSWSNENRGLYPQSVQLNYNPMNTALGVRYGYLFQRPVLNMPLGVYVTFSNTINPNPHYINYAWERKYSIGGTITAPYDLEMHGIYTMFTLGLVYNEHPRANQDLSLPPGQFMAGYKATSNFGLDIGVMIQLNHLAFHLKADAVNWMSYVEVGAGITFFRIRK